MADAFLQFVSIQPTQSTQATAQAPAGKANPHGNKTMKGGLYSDRRKKACSTGK